MRSMPDEEPIDLFALDPAREPERWQAFVAATRLRAYAALEARRQAQDPLGLIAAWMRPVLLAAAAVLALLVPAERVLDRYERQARTAHVLAELSLRWADGARPSGAALLHAFTGGGSR